MPARDRARQTPGVDPAAVVDDADAAVGHERDLDLGRVPGHRLVDRVVDDLEHHVMQARAVIGVADVHARPLPDGVQAFQHLDCTGVVVAAGDVVLGRVRRVVLISHVVFFNVISPCSTWNIAWFVAA